MKSQQSYPLRLIAEMTGCELLGNGDDIIDGINSLQSATSSQLSFLSQSSYQALLSESRAGCVILSPNAQALFLGNKLISANPYYTYAQVSQLFAKAIPSHSTRHPSAVIGEHCMIAEEVSLGPNVVIGGHVTIARGSHIGAGCIIGDNCFVGDDCILHPNVSIYSDTQIGDRCIIHSQAVIGSDGFGFAPTNDASGSWQKIYQLGGVTIGCDVEIGAGTTIDRGALENTVISDGVKLDNQIQVAHNVCIGENTAIAGAAAIAGSTVIGKRCTIAGAVGIVGHLSIADDVHITAMTLVTKSITESGSYSSGTPMNKTSVWRKNAARFNRLGK